MTIQTVTLRRAELSFEVPSKTLERRRKAFAQRHGVRIDPCSPAYVAEWLRHPDPLLPLPDLAVWYREPGLWVPLSLAITPVGTPFNGGFTNGSSHSYSYTVAGGSGDFLLVAVAIAAGATDLTGVTVNGASMTALGNNRGQSAVSWDVYAFGIMNPSTGSQTIAVSRSGSGLILSGCAEYNGLNNLTLDAGPVTGQVNVSGGTPLTLTLTTIAVNCWTFMVANGETSLSAGASTTFRVQDASFFHWAILDSGAPISPAGSTSLNMIQASAGHMAGLMFSLAPSGGAPPSFGPEVFQPLSQPTGHYRPTIIM